MSEEGKSHMHIDSARPSDWPAIRSLLEREGLPAGDLEESALEWFLVSLARRVWSRPWD